MDGTDIRVVVEYEKRRAQMQDALGRLWQVLGDKHLQCRISVVVVYFLRMMEVQESSL